MKNVGSPLKNSYFIRRFTGLSLMLVVLIVCASMTTCTTSMEWQETPYTMNCLFCRTEPHETHVVQDCYGRYWLDVRGHELVQEMSFPAWKSDTANQVKISGVGIKVDRRVKSVEWDERAIVKLHHKDAFYKYYIFNAVSDESTTFKNTFIYDVEDLLYSDGIMPSGTPADFDVNDGIILDYNDLDQYITDGPNMIQVAETIDDESQLWEFITNFGCTSEHFFEKPDDETILLKGETNCVGRVLLARSLAQKAELPIEVYSITGYLGVNGASHNAYQVRDESGVFLFTQVSFIGYMMVYVYAPFVTTTLFHTDEAMASGVMTDGGNPPGSLYDMRPINKLTIHKVDE